MSSDRGLLQTALPWVEAGLAAGDVVVLSVAEEAAELVREHLGPAPAHLVSEPRVSMRGARAPDAVTVLRRLIDRASASGSGRVRVLGTPAFGRTPLEWREGQRFESMVNVVFDGTAVDSLCLYDRRVLPQQVVASARHTHPYVLVDGDRVRSPEYVLPRQYVTGLPLSPEGVEAGAPRYAVEAVPTLVDLRHQLAAVLGRSVPDREQFEDLHLAVSEIAANAFRHGAQPVSARVWASADRVVCTITDHGAGMVDPLAGFRPAHGDDLSRGGMGLWLARKLWDHVDLLHGPDGFTVRLSTRLR